MQQTKIGGKMEQLNSDPSVQRILYCAISVREKALTLALTYFLTVSFVKEKRDENN